MSRISASSRLRRLLAMVPWIAAHEDGVALDEVAQRFDLSREQLLSDLEVVFMVGVHPFTPAEMIDVVIDDDRVWIRYADWFTRPLRLTPGQALALVASSKSLQSVRGADPDGPLARALGKVAATLHIDTDRDLDVDLGDVDPEVLAVVEEGIEAHRRVTIDYYAYGRDERSTRAIEPHRLWSDQGHWYVAAYCHRAEGDRVFRLDRVGQAVLEAERFEPPEADVELAVFAPSPNDPRVVLELAPSARWVLGQYPHEEVTELDEGRVRVTLAITAERWLERLLLSLGPQVRVVGGAERFGDLGASAAERVLTRYRRTPEVG